MKNKISKLLIRLAHGLIRLLLFTCRIRIIGLESFLKVAEKQPCALMLWHDRLALIGPLGWRYASHLSYAAFVSASRDGQLVTEICESYPHCRTISVSHDKRHHALRELINQLTTRHEVLLITPDGPRGPRHQVKPGIALAAKRAEAPVIPVSWSASRFWQLKTWDKMIFPKPFSKIVLHFGDPIWLEDAQNETRLEQELLKATKNACSAITLDQEKWPS